MKKLRFKEPYNHHYEYTDDIDRIIKVFADRGYEISREDCVRAWESYSESYAAEWGCLGDDEEIFGGCFYYFGEVE